MFDYRALVILMTLMDHCELSLYELSVKVSLPIKGSQRRNRLFSALSS
ncbi:transcriptional regulator%2C BglG family [Streptococcus pneumoniae]|nr:transcriptional regulator%2C BglG family [Streptococcus pneumoniae]CJT34479.1 transcriptional regulator%2C BglG family [Streptococcus pneumoniae]CKD82772.1 transcriptional regulator%2C BglG family [Streptococcus pneumoniae]CKF45966.1 transcriptional regulator%2C BglG family [Streptococcus pneumoniae]